MISSAKSNMYEVNATSTLAVYHDFVRGTGREVALAISSHPLNEAARSALVKSFVALGYGRDACAWAILSAEGEAGGGARSTAAGAGGGTNDPAAKAGGTALGAEAASVAGSEAGDVKPQLGALDLMSIIEGLDPLVMVTTDEHASELLGRAYRCSLSPDSAARVMGRTCACFRNLEVMMESEVGKQRAWALLKKLPKFR